MKKIILFFAFAASVVAVNAQDAAGGAAFGIKGGLNFASLKNKAGGNSESSDMKIGFHVGGFVNVPLGETFAFQPELVFSQEGGKEEVLNEDAKLNLTYLNVPLLLQYNASGFFAETGPQIGFLLGAKSKYGDLDEDVKDQMETINLSWAVGLGFKTASGLGFGARYNLGLSNMSKDADNDESTKGNVIQISIFKTLGK